MNSGESSQSLEWLIVVLLKDRSGLPVVEPVVSVASCSLEPTATTQSQLAEATPPPASYTPSAVLIPDQELLFWHADTDL